jgi:hypothetical protein
MPDKGRQFLHLFSGCRPYPLAVVAVLQSHSLVHKSWTVIKDMVQGLAHPALWAVVVIYQSLSLQDMSGSHVRGPNPPHRDCLPRIKSVVRVRSSQWLSVVVVVVVLAVGAEASILSLPFHPYGSPDPVRCVLHFHFHF